jgi:hypothetical protein
LVTVTLPLAAIFDSIRSVLGQILSSRAGPTRVNPRASRGRTYGRTADRSRRECTATL